MTSDVFHFSRGPRFRDLFLLVFRVHEKKRKPHGLTPQTLNSGPNVYHVPLLLYVWPRSKTLLLPLQTVTCSTPRTNTKVFPLPVGAETQMSRLCTCECRSVATMSGTTRVWPNKTATPTRTKHKTRNMNIHKLEFVSFNVRRIGEPSKCVPLLLPCSTEFCIRTTAPARDVRSIETGVGANMPDWGLANPVIGCFTLFPNESSVEKWRDAISKSAQPCMYD